MLGEPQSHLHGWSPVAASDDLPLRHVFHGQLWGQELAIWRADDGNVNVWENRCLHRGVRLSIGVNDGAELKCQYHGWRYANRTAGCTYIPAHPANAPARTITNRTFPWVECHGMVWTTLGEIGAFADPLPGTGWLPLRPVPVNAAPDAVLDALTGAATDVSPVGPLAVAVRLAGGAAAFFVQPVDAGRAVLRGLLPAATPDMPAALRRYNRILTGLRDRIEVVGHPAPAPIAPRYDPVPAALAALPDRMPGSRGRITAVVRRKWHAAEDVTGLELAPVTGTLPTFQPGAHIDLSLPGGLVRQYSLINGPGDWQAWVIGVKLDPASRGGSRAVAQTLRQGDLVAVSDPRNNFPLRRDATRTVLIAGGIGLTPLLSMARALARSDLPMELHVFARTVAHVPFADVLGTLGDRVTLHTGLSPTGTGARLSEILGAHQFAHHAYVCGPAPMIAALRATAAAQGWPEDAVHFEYFANGTPRDASSTFTIELARSALTLEVLPGKSILEVMRANGVEALSSCETGACGTCKTTVLAGTPDHQDVYLTESEKAAGRCMMTCVSRARSPRLVLDI